MREEPDADDDLTTGSQSRFARVRSAISTAIGALAALALLLALGVWFYRLGVRDAQNVPIIRASTEPAKTRPDDPGGVIAPHQDVSSYEAASGEPAQAAAAIIAPPPPEPRQDDVSMGALSTTVSVSQDEDSGSGSAATNTTSASVAGDTLTTSDARRGITQRSSGIRRCRYICSGWSNRS